MTRILFLCTRNSCRSQMAEGFGRALLGPSVEVFSAGSESYRVDPRAAQVMEEVGIDLSTHRSKTIDEFRDTALDFVYSVCGDAKDKCPVWVGEGKHRHRGFEDPPRLAAEDASGSDPLDHYRRVRDEIRAWVEILRAELADG